MLPYAPPALPGKIGLQAGNDCYLLLRKTGA
jgi:hypothetical protein